MSDRSGYSLIETLVAFAVLSVVLAALVPGQLLVLSRATGSDDRLLAFEYAISQVEAAEVFGAAYAQSIPGEINGWSISTIVEQSDPNSPPSFTITILDRVGRQLATAASSRLDDER